MTTIDPYTLAKDIANLACLNRKRIPYARSDSQTKKFLEGRFSNMIDSALRKGVAYGFYDGKKLVAYYIRYWGENYGPTTQTIVTDHLHNNRTGIDSIKSILTQDKKYFRRRTCLSFGEHAKEMIQFAIKMGFAIDGLVLCGRRTTAERGLATLPTPPKFSSVGLRKKRLTTRDEVNQCLRIQKREFTRNPQFGWFIATPEFTKTIRNILLTQISSKNPTTRTWVLVDRNNKTWGFYSMFLRKKDPLWGPSTGLGIILHEKIQKKGLVKTIYAHLLKEMKREGITNFMGGTAQPPVMGLAKVLGRQVFIVELMYGKGHFKPEHFGY